MKSKSFKTARHTARVERKSSKRRQQRKSAQAYRRTLPKIKQMASYRISRGDIRTLGALALLSDKFWRAA